MLLHIHATSRMANTLASLGSQGQIEPQSSIDSDFPIRLRGKRVLLATESFGPVNGVSRTTQNLVKYLRKNGVHVAVVAPKYKGFIPRASNRNEPELRVHGYPLPYSPDLTVAYPLRLDRLCSRTFQPDLIYLASPASLGFQVLLQIRQMTAPPTVLLNFQTDLSAYSEIIFPSPMDRYAVWLLRTVQGFLFNHRAIHTIFYPSGGVRDYMIKAGAPRDRMVHLGRGVDTDMFAPSRKDLDYRKQIAPNGEIILVSVGRLALEKGLEFLAQVAKLLVERGVSFKLLVVGGNKSPNVDAGIRRLFSEFKDRVVFAGFLTGVSLAQAYAVGDIFLHCSVTETFGLVVLEAMASGLPVVARAEGGPVEIVADGKSGYLVPPDDMEQFIRRVEELAKDDELRISMSSVARDMACQKTWDLINRQVALRMTSALDHQDLIAADPSRSTRIRSWLYSHWGRLVSSIVVALRINAAIGVICFIWLIAVVPLLIHGNDVIPRMWRQLQSLSTWNTMGDFVSQQVKLKGR
jgi:glycosyltransferase involved in cell wall biosynthesis